MPANFTPSGGGSSISNAGGTVSIDGDGAVHVTPADGQNTNIGGGALAISAPIEDSNTAVFKAVDGHTFYTGALGSEVLVATIGPGGITGTPISGANGNFLGTIYATHSFTDGSNYSRLKIDVTGSAVAFSADEAGTGVGTLTRYSFDRGMVFVNPDDTFAGGVQFRRANGHSWGFTIGQDDALYFGYSTTSITTSALRLTNNNFEVTPVGGGDTAIILSSPNGTRYRVSVSNIGVVTATAI